MVWKKRKGKKGREKKEKKKKKRRKTMTADPGDGLLPGGLPGTVYSFSWPVIGHQHRQ